MLSVLLVEIFTKFKNTWNKKDIRNWFHDDYMVRNPGKCEFTSFKKAIGSDVFAYHEIQL